MAQEHWQEHHDIYALGALDGQELKDFEAHLAPGCAICEARGRETHEALNLLNRSLQPLTPRAVVKRRVFEQIEKQNVVPIGAAPLKTPRRWQRITGILAAGFAGLHGTR